MLSHVGYTAYADARPLSYHCCLYNLRIGRPPPFQPKETRLWYIIILRWNAPKDSQQMVHRMFIDPLVRPHLAGRASACRLPLSSFSAWVSSCDRDSVFLQHCKGSPHHSMPGWIIADISHKMSGIVRTFWKDSPMKLPMDINVIMIIPEILKLKCIAGIRVP